jgi:CubicO group peptidase (beta-lactamase class C family)
VILATLLNDGTSPTTNAVILQRSTVDDMFTNQIPKLPNFGRQHMDNAKPDLVNSVDEFFPQPLDQEQGWGLTFMITPHPAPTGRGANAVHWAGLPNLWWWCDREKGIAGMICSQILPSGDPKVGALIGAVESTVYKYLG